MNKAITVWAIASTIYSVYVTANNIDLHDKMVQTELDRSRDTARFCTLQDSTLDAILRSNAFSRPVPFMGPAKTNRVVKLNSPPDGKTEPRN